MMGFLLSSCFSQITFATKSFSEMSVAYITM